MSTSATKVVNGASACLVDAEGRVLLIAREKEPFRGAFAFPGGSIEPGETALEAARRELFEETGYGATGEPIAQLVVEMVRDGTCFRIDSFAFTEWLAPEAPDAPGEMKTVWLTFDEAFAETLAPGMAIALREFQRAFKAITAPKSAD